MPSSMAVIVGCADDGSSVWAAAFSALRSCSASANAANRSFGSGPDAHPDIEMRRPQITIVHQDTSSHTRPS
jgi:hypothetical protein